MTKEPTTSEHCLASIDALDIDNDTESIEPGEQALEVDERTVRLIVQDLIASREAFTGSNLAVIETLVRNDRSLFEYLVDDRLTRDLLYSIPSYVKRILSLSRLESGTLPSQTTNVYLREAVRTYVFGLSQASIALSRAALEQSLKDGLGYQSTKTYVPMKDLLEEAEGAGVLDELNRRVAREIAAAANDVLHEKPSDDSKAYEVLVLLRGVLQHVYRED